MVTMPLRRLPSLTDHNRGLLDSRKRERNCAGIPSFRFLDTPARTGDLPEVPPRRSPVGSDNRGKATLFTYTVNHKAWNPDVPVPYAIGIVELPEQVGLRMTTNIVRLCRRCSVRGTCRVAG